MFRETGARSWPGTEIRCNGNNDWDFQNGSRFVSRVNTENRAWPSRAIPKARRRPSDAIELNWTPQNLTDPSTPSDFSATITNWQLLKMCHLVLLCNIFSVSSPVWTQRTGPGRAGRSLKPTSRVNTLNDLVREKNSINSARVGVTWSNTHDQGH